MVVVPKLIHPLPPSAIDGDGSPPKKGPGGQTLDTAADPWLESINRERPPTPPRGRPAARNDNRNSLAWI